MINQKKWLITWWNGRLGRASKKILPDAMYPSKFELNILDLNSLDEYFKNNDIEVVIHLAALANITKCELDKRLARDTNVWGVRNILDASKRKWIKKFIYLQTACIFNGEETDWYNEDDLPNPKNYYWITKMIAEEIVKTYNSISMHTIVVRTNFTSMPWEYPKAFTDRFGTYLFAQWVIKGIREIIESNTLLNIIHVCWERELSMYEYAKLGGSNVLPITLSEYQWPPLTRRMSLKTTKRHTYKIEDSDFIDS
jgi:dTDP-4-dehydrorhamnose reductase